MLGLELGFNSCIGKVLQGAKVVRGHKPQGFNFLPLFLDGIPAPINISFPSRERQCVHSSLDPSNYDRLERVIVAGA